MSNTVSDTFTYPCPCGETGRVVGGVEQPHEHREITVQMLRDAYADGYELGKREASDAAS